VSRVPCAKDKFCTVQTIRRPQRKHPRLVVLHWQLLIPKKCSHPVVKPEASGRPLRVKQPYVDPCISDFAPQLLSVFLTSASASGRLNNTLLTYYVQSAVKVIVQSPSSRVSSPSLPFLSYFLLPRASYLPCFRVHQEDNYQLDTSPEPLGYRSRTYHPHGIPKGTRTTSASSNTSLND